MTHIKRTRTTMVPRVARLAPIAGLLTAASALAGCASSSGSSNGLQHAPWYHSSYHSPSVDQAAPSLSDRRSGG
ncbi:MAG: hypothetical protein ACYSVY_26605 [Planctomycetota bacterium]|jgi:hypothetical protein